MPTRTDPSPTAGGTDECTTTRSFENHGLDDGAELIRQTYYQLLAAGVTDFEPTGDFFDELESAFLRAYMLIVGESVPKHVEAAANDARAVTEEECVERDAAELRTEVLPRFYQQAAGFHCRYRG